MAKYIAFGEWLLCVLVITLLMTGCSAFKNIKNIFSPKEMGPPSVSLLRVEAARESGWWFYAQNIPATRGEAGNHGAPLILAFVFKIKNPNTYPIMMDSINFTVTYENTRLDEIQLSDIMWIPSGQANELRVYSMLDVESAIYYLLVKEGEALKQEGKSFWSVIQKYWTEIPQFKNPISASDGKAEFKAKNMTKIIYFSAAYTKKPKEAKKDETAEPGESGKSPAEEVKE